MFRHPSNIILVRRPHPFLNCLGVHQLIVLRGSTTRGRTTLNGGRCDILLAGTHSCNRNCRRWIHDSEGFAGKQFILFARGDSLVRLALKLKDGDSVSVLEAKLAGATTDQMLSQGTLPSALALPDRPDSTSYDRGCIRE